MIDIMLAISVGFLLGMVFTEFVGAFEEDYESCDFDEIEYELQNEQ